MEGELFSGLYPLIVQEASRRPSPKGVRFGDGIILLVALWAAVHDRPVSWACRKAKWHGTLAWLQLPSGATMSRRLRSLSVQLLLEQVYGRLLQVVMFGLACAFGPFCLCRRLDSKPLPVGGFSKDRDARRGYATGGTAKGYKLFGCWGNCPVVPEAFVLGPLSESDQAGGLELLGALDRLHQGQTCGYVLADSTHDTNPLHRRGGETGVQLVTPRKEPGAGLGHRDHAPQRLRSIELLEPPPIPPADPAPRFGPELHRQRGQIERDYGNLCGFAGGLQPLPNFVRRPRRVALWVTLKLLINGIRICRNHGLTP